MKLIDENGRFTKEGSVFCEKIDSALEPIIGEMIMKNGATPQDVTYIIGNRMRYMVAYQTTLREINEQNENPKGTA